jgi:galactokinase
VTSAPTIASLEAAFARIFGRPPSIVGRAPGRVNLIGEHTDYSGGFVLPAPVPLHTTVALARREDAIVRAYSTHSHGATGSVPAFQLGDERRTGGWVDYVAGVTSALRKAGYAIRGADLFVTSDLPIGSGLSSSAALLVATLRAFSDAFDLSLDGQAVASFAWQAETGLVGAPVGIMDQMVCSLGSPGSALFLDTKSRTFELVPIPAAAEIAVVDSRLHHHHASGEYRIRRSECETAAAALGVPLLRDLTPGDLPRVARLPAPLSRRARHVVLENARVVSAVQALRRSDLSSFGELMNASHASLRDDFEVSTPEIDRLVSAAQAAPHVYGARITGGGFGGSIVIVTDAGHARAVATSVCRDAEAHGWCRPAAVVPVRRPSKPSQSHASIP